MASLGHSQSENHIRVLIPPDEVVEQLMADLVTTDHPRLANNSQLNEENNDEDNSDDSDPVIEVDNDEDSSRST
jgi:hypothetical protein